jgi:hypothetical protein
VDYDGNQLNNIMKFGSTNKAFKYPAIGGQAGIADSDKIVKIKNFGHAFGVRTGNFIAYTGPTPAT